jgi:hypothetical protein
VEGNVSAVRSPAKPRVLFREVNERIRALHRSALGEIDFVCECDGGDCFAVLRLTGAEYEQVRARRGAYAVVPGHTATDLRLVLATERFDVLAPPSAA